MEPVEFRRRLHAHPELSFKEHDTAAFIEQQLDELGIKPLSTLRHLEILPETFGVKLPEELVREVKAHPDGVREVGTEWAIAQSRELMAAGVPLLHYYTMSRTTNIQKIVKAVF